MTFDSSAFARARAMLLPKFHDPVKDEPDTDGLKKIGKTIRKNYTQRMPDICCGDCKHSINHYGQWYCSLEGEGIWEAVEVYAWCDDWERNVD